jgi:uncharacterized membrane protein YbaN (DUF454 family)
VAQLHNSRLVRGLLLVAGVISLGVGIVGIFLPLLPTAPLVILAAACFRAGLPSLSRMVDGPPLVRPDAARVVSPSQRALSRQGARLIAMLIGFGGSIMLFVRPAWAQLLCAVVALALAVLLYRIPSRDGPRS